MAIFSIKIENVNPTKVLCRTVYQYISIYRKALGRKVLCSTVYQYRNLPTTDFDQICQHHKCSTFECHPNMATQIRSAKYNEQIETKI